MIYAYNPNSLPTIDELVGMPLEAVEMLSGRCVAASLVIESTTADESNRAFVAERMAGYVNEKLRQEQL